MTPEKLLAWLDKKINHCKSQTNRTMSGLDHLHNAEDAEALAQLRGMLASLTPPNVPTWEGDPIDDAVHSVPSPKEPPVARFSVDGAMLTRAEILKLPLEKRREILKGMAEGALKPCPFCGEKLKDVKEANQVEEHTIGFFSLVCKNCGTVGPEGRGIEGAIAAWNRRAK